MKKNYARIISASAISVLLVSALCIGSYAALQNSNSESGKYIAEDRAKEIALESAGLSADAVRFVDAELDYERGIVHYEIEFRANGIEYEYEIDAESGKILKAKSERDDDVPARPAQPAPSEPAKPAQSEPAEPSEPAKPAQSEPAPSEPAKPEQPAEPVYISLDEAKAIALENAGLSADAVRFVEAKRDRDDGMVVYELEFKANGIEYEYEIDAVSGKILEADKEIDD